MPGKRVSLLVYLAASFLILALGSGGIVAQETTPGDAAAPQASLGTAFTYQGELSRDGSPYTGTCDFRFSLHDAASGGNQLGSTQTLSGVAVTSGRFTVALNGGDEFGGAAFIGEARWLRIQVKCSGDGSYTALSPRQALTPAPHALALPGLLTLQNATSPNIVGGYWGNGVLASVVGATISGGGESVGPHLVTADFATVGGGYANTASGYAAKVGGGRNNTASGHFATVGGGTGNTANSEISTVGGGDGNTASVIAATVGGGDGNAASDIAATVGGGYGNTASGYAATVAGGDGNTASGSAATVAGGGGNTASGYGATVSGGDSNTAAGEYSMAAGRGAKANHDGTFVWADHTPADFASTAADQFLIRAGGGVGIGTNSPQADLNVAADSTLNRPQILISETGSGDHARLRFANAGQAAHWDLAAGGANNQLNFYRSDAGDIMQLKPGDATNLLLMSNGARLTAGGAWTNASDRQLKADLAPVDAADLLHRVASLPIATWRYTVEPESVRHIGPTAQDFFAAFGLGSDDRSISTVDTDGVALAAIQGLHRVVREQGAQIAAQQGQIEELQARLARLEGAAGQQGAAPHWLTLWPLLGGLVVGCLALRHRREGGSRL